MTSVLIIDDHPIVLQGCRRLLQDHGITPIHEARDVESAVRTGARLGEAGRPFVLVTDVDTANALIRDVQ